jgi:hypothetical protein
MAKFKVIIERIETIVKQAQITVGDIGRRSTAADSAYAAAISAIDAGRFAVTASLSPRNINPNTAT